VNSKDGVEKSAEVGVSRMVKAFRTSWIAAAVVAFAGLAFAEPAPPSPHTQPPDKTATPALAQPEVPSPCTFDLDAEWLVPLKSGSVKTVRKNVPRPVNCEGAVITAVSATGKESVTTLQFAVAYKPGHDRAGFISFAILNDDNRSVGVGETQDNLVAGATTQLTGSVTIKSREFDRVFATDNNPVMRITLRLGHE
jgi:hypothetical protein